MWSCDDISCHRSSRYGTCHKISLHIIDAQLSSIQFGSILYAVDGILIRPWEHHQRDSYFRERHRVPG